MFTTLFTDHLSTCSDRHPAVSVWVYRTAPPTDGADGDVGGLAGRAVAEAGDGAVVGGGRHQTGHRQNVRGGRLRLAGLKETSRHQTLNIQSGADGSAVASVTTGESSTSR